LRLRERSGGMMEKKEGLVSLQDISFTLISDGTALARRGIVLRPGSALGLRLGSVTDVTNQENLG
jgi:hypothetical protein